MKYIERAMIVVVCRALAAKVKRGVVWRCAMHDRVLLIAFFRRVRPFLKESMDV